MRQLSHRLMMVLLVGVSLLWGTVALAAAKPVITSHTPQYTEGALVVTVQWQSENPVIRATLTAGQEQKIVKLEDDNRRIPDGYTGEVVINAPAQRPMSGDQMFYSLQLEDEYRLKSELVQGRLTLPKQAMPGMPGSMPVDDGWGQNQGRIQLPQHQQGQAGQPGQLPPVPQTGQMFQQPMLSQQPGMVPGQTPQPAYPQQQYPQQYPQQPGMGVPSPVQPYQSGMLPPPQMQPGMVPGSAPQATGVTPPPPLPAPVDPGMMQPPPPLPPPVDPGMMQPPPPLPPPVP